MLHRNYQDQFNNQSVVAVKYVNTRLCIDRLVWSEILKETEDMYIEECVRKDESLNECIFHRKLSRQELLKKEKSENADPESVSMFFVTPINSFTFHPFLHIDEVEPVDIEIVTTVQSLVVESIEMLYMTHFYPIYVELLQVTSRYDYKRLEFELL